MKGVILCVLAYVATAQSVVEGDLVEFSFTQHQVYGKYLSKDRVHGIIFFSGADDYLLIKTLSDKIIVETAPLTERDGKKLRSVYIMGHEYLQHVGSPSHPADYDTPLSDALHELMNVQEASFLKEASEAVGQKGLTGKNTPAAMPLFVFAQHVTHLLTERARDVGVFMTNSTRVQRAADCSNKCPPCPNNDCFGMCGKGCSCWKFVCGDCCWHVGCFYHDKCCAEDFFQTDCLFPLGFRCDQPYKC